MKRRPSVRLYLFPPRRSPRVLAAALLGVVLLAGAGARLVAQNEPDYPHGDLAEDCSLCHTDSGWTPARIRPEFHHEDLAGFALQGAHASLECRACHQVLDFAQADASCSSCHTDVHRGEMGIDCSRCHGTQTFIDRGDQLRLHRGTRFPLSGAHLTLDCRQCHEATPVDDLVFVGTPASCEQCHLDLYQATANPDHQKSGFSTRCVSCHSTNHWSGARFDHSATGFPLKGAHQALDCSDCHGSSGLGGGGPVNCYDCHRAEYEATTSPAHLASGFPVNCEQCHNGTAWKPADFDHGLSGFPLTGAHRGLSCDACHADGAYDGKPTDCYSCHRQDYEGTTDPNHQAAGYSTDCMQCHDTNDWSHGNFDHQATDFPLTGAHRGLSCDACHADGVYGGKPTDCYSCHRQDYEGTTDPNHQAAGYTTDCMQCHDTKDWSHGNFDHQATDFPLTGAHRGLSCD
ncbi:MAG: cytochrome c3 family protein, partial [Acidobacteriota bacterium]|nr:cytochrome c3 family protein [Acidobacteriota bacterium]